MEGDGLVETVAFAPSEWDSKASVLKTWLTNITKLSFSKWCTAEKKAATERTLKLGATVDRMSVGDLSLAHTCSGIA